jgi:hypothetical protein
MAHATVRQTPDRLKLARRNREEVHRMRKVAIRVATAVGSLLALLIAGGAPYRA